MRLNLSLRSRKSYLLSTLTCLSLGVSSLNAYDVTDGGDNNVAPYTIGQLRYGVDNAQDPITIKTPLNLVTLTADMLNPVASFTLDTDTVGGATIDGSGSNYSLVLINSGVTVTMDANITCTNMATVSIDGDGFTAGTLVINSANNIASNSTIQLSPTGNIGTLEAATTTTLTNNIVVGATGGGSLNAQASQTLTLNGIISGNDSSTILMINGAVVSPTGTVVLGAVNTYQGGTQVEAGTLSISSVSNLGSDPNGLGVILDGGSLLVTGSNTFDRAFSTMGPTGSINVATGQNADWSGALAFTTATLVINDSGTTGTLTLSNNTNDIQDIQIQAGTLAVSNIGQLCAGDVAIYDSANLSTTTGITIPNTNTITLTTVAGNNSGSINVAASQTTTVNAVIGEAGGTAGTLNKTGTGTLVFGATNTYTGDTVIQAGTLAISDVNHIASSSGVTIYDGATLSTTTGVTATQAITLNAATSSGATISVSPSQTTTLNGAIGETGGAGILNKTGTGTLVLGATNTYTGDTLVQAGTLAISAATNLQGTSGVTIYDGATLNVTAGMTLAKDIASNSGTPILKIDGDTTISSVISGTGGFAKTGTSVLTLSGTSNTYQGVTQIQAGTLAISSDSNLGNSSGIQLYDGATLSTTTGVTTSKDITLVANGGSNTGTINVASSQTTTLNGDIGQSGATAGTLVKTGAGTLILAGTNTYTGDTTVSAGTLKVTGSTESPISIASGGTLTVDGTMTSSSTVTIPSGATLNGTGTLVGDVSVSGTIAPGNSIGTLTVTGDYTQASGSTFECEVSPTASDQLIVNGNVTISSGATFQLIPAAGSYTPDTMYTVISTNGGIVSGEFGTFTNNDSAIVTGQLFYEANSVRLLLAFNDFNDVVTTGNAGSVARVIDLIYDDDGQDMDDIFLNLVTLNNSQLSFALDQMHPALLKGMTLIQQDNAVRVNDTVGYRMQNVLDNAHCKAVNECQECNKPFSVWTDAFGDILDQKSVNYASSNQVGYHNTTAGIVMGLDYHFAKYFYAGVFSAYTHSDVKWKGQTSTGDINTGYAGAYGSVIGKLFYANTSLMGSWSGYEAHRAIVYTGMDRTADSKHHGNQFFAHLDTGLNFGIGSFAIRPFDAVDYISQNESFFSESGAGALDLDVRQSNASMLRNELGLNFAKCFSFHHSKWTIDTKFSWIREMRLHGGLYQSNFRGTTPTFTVTGYAPNRNLYSPGLTLTGVMLKDRLTLNAYYNAAFGRKYRDQSVGGQLGFSF